MTPLPEDLLEGAQFLATKDKRKPKQANLRRAISSAYYALFHLLVEDASSMVVKDAKLRNLVRRAFQHGTMAKACKAIVGGTLPDPLKSIWAGSASAELREVARTFIELHQVRHDADYNAGRSFTRSESRELIGKAKACLGIWRKSKMSPKERECFQASLLLWDMWRR